MAIQVVGNTVTVTEKDFPIKVKIVNNRKEVKEYEIKRTKKGGNVMNKA